MGVSGRSRTRSTIWETNSLIGCCRCAPVSRKPKHLSKGRMMRPPLASPLRLFARSDLNSLQQRRSRWPAVTVTATTIAVVIALLNISILSPQLISFFCFLVFVLFCLFSLGGISPISPQQSYLQYYTYWVFVYVLCCLASAAAPCSSARATKYDRSLYAPAAQIANTKSAMAAYTTCSVVGFILPSCSFKSFVRR
jgi:hypothetical protein